MQLSKGFTLIELVIVIVVLAIIAATALPKFASFSQDARIAVVDEFSGAYKSATTIFKSAWAINGNQASVPGYTGIVANNQGIATGTGDDQIAHEADCTNLWTQLLAEPPAISFISGNAGWAGSFSGQEWGSSASKLATEADDHFCHYVYVKGISAGSGTSAPMLVYNITTGEVSTGFWPYNP